jgi:hypothetical protein
MRRRKAEFVRRWLRRDGLLALLRRELRMVLPPTDYGVLGLVLVVLALVLSGGRRLRHLRYLDGDPIVLPLLWAAVPADGAHGRALVGGVSGTPSPAAPVGQRPHRRPRHSSDRATAVDDLGTAVDIVSDMTSR